MVLARGNDSNVLGVARPSTPLRNEVHEADGVQPVQITIVYQSHFKPVPFGTDRLVVRVDRAPLLYRRYVVEDELAFERGRLVRRWEDGELNAELAELLGRVDPFASTVVVREVVRTTLPIRTGIYPA